MITMQCPSCGHSLRIADEFSGRKGKCKYCNNFIIVSGKTIDTPNAEDKHTQQNRNHQPHENEQMREAQRQLAEARAVQAALKRDKEDRRSRRIMFGVIFVITAALIAGGVWYRNRDTFDLKSVFLPNGSTNNTVDFIATELHGVRFPSFGETPVALDVSIEWSAAFEGVAKDAVQCYQIPTTGSYADVTSRVQLALTTLDWDYIIWMGEDPVPHTELYGLVNDRNAAVRIEEVLDEVYVYVGVNPV